MVAYVLIICASLLQGSCVSSYFRFTDFAACEDARAGLKGEYQWAKCVPESAVLIPELYPEED